MTGIRRSAGARRPPWWAAVALALAAGACTTAAQRTGGVDVELGGGDVLGLDSARQGDTTVEAQQLRLPSSPAVGAATVLDCQIAPLLTAQASRCDLPQGSANRDRLCVTPSAEQAAGVIGWVVTSAGRGQRTLAVLVRSSNPERVDYPEVVVVSLATARVGADSAPPLQSVTPRRIPSRTVGEGCASPAVTNLSADGRGLHLSGL